MFILSFVPMRKLLLLIFLVNGFVFASAQQVLRGFALDNDTKEPLVFAHVVLNDGPFGTTTDLSGFFEVEARVPISKIRILIPPKDTST